MHQNDSDDHRMYVAYGWPRILSVKADSVQEDVVHLSLNDDYLVVVSTVSVQIWSGDQHRVKLGRLTRDAESIAADGLNRRAVWCGSRRLLAVLVRFQDHVHGQKDAHILH